MNIILNGENYSLDKQNATIKDLIEQVGVDIKKVAIEKNLEIIPCSSYNNEVINDGDKIEMIHFIGGG